MTANGPSMLSLAAAGVYALAVLSCLGAAFYSQRKHQQFAHLRTWIILALFFVALAYLRISNLEEIWRDELRNWLRADGAYADRRSFQGPLAAGVFAISAILAFVWIARVLRLAQNRRSIAVAVAQLGGLVMLALITLRMVSFSMIDKLLYGPAKLNWIGDLGSTLLVAGAAVYYVRILMVSAPRRQRD